MMKHFRLLSAILIFTSCSSGTTSSDDNRQNVKLLWREPTFEWVTSSILIKDNTVFFGSSNDTFYSTNLENARIKLKFKTGYDPYFLPVINNNRVLFSSFDQNIYCIDTLGNLIWKTPVKERIKSSLIEDDSLVFASVRGDGLQARKKRDGSLVWHLGQDSQSLSTSQPIIHLDKIFVGLWELDNKVIAVDKSTGKVLWTNKYPGHASSDPAISPNGLVISIDKFYEGGQVKVLDYYTGNEIWSQPLKCEALFKPFTDNENVIVGTYDSKVVCLDNTNGKIKWTLNLLDGENADTDICSFNQNIYFGTTMRNLYCVDIANGQTVFKEPFNYGISNPLVVDDKIYFPTGGSELWTLR
jgi:outer membrane protein assembly factor BamB